MGPRCLAEPGEGFMTCVVNLDLNLHSLWIFVFNILPASMDLGVKDHVPWRNLLASIFRSLTTINCCHCLASSGAPWRCCRCCRGCRQRHVLGNLPAGSQVEDEHEYPPGKKNISHLGNFGKSSTQNAILGGYVRSLEGSQLELEIGFLTTGDCYHSTGTYNRLYTVSMPPFVTHVGLFKASQITNKGFQVIISLKSTQSIIVPSTNQAVLLR